MTLQALRFSLAAFAVAFSFSAQAEASTEADSLAVANAYFKAFASHDAATMASLYQESTEEIFQDPVFTPALNTHETRVMWRMLLAQPVRFSVDYEIQKVIGRLVVAKWTAQYVYSASGRFVVNQGTTTMKIENGKIVQQTDSFNVCEWFQMAYPEKQAGAFCLKPEIFRAGIRKKLSELATPKKLAQ